MPTVNIHQAKTHLSRLLDQALSGEEVIIAKAGKAIARLVPLERKVPRKPGLLKGQLAESFFDPLSDEDLVKWGQ
jgi:prevent-host-death family protein